MFIQKFTVKRQGHKMDPKIAITIRSFEATQSLLTSFQDIGEISYVNDTGKRLSEDELCKAVKNVVGVIAGTEKFTRRVFESSQILRVISRVGVGLDSIDLDAAQEHGVIVVNTPDAPIQAVAEHTLALIFAVLKRITIYNDNIRNGEYTVESGLLLNGRSVGIIGLGRIGRKVAEILEGLGCKIIYYDPFLKGELDNTWQRVELLSELLENADIVSLHLPPQKDNEPILDNKAFKKCREGVVVINTARGSLIDEGALIQAIGNGIIWGVGLDVFPFEPYTGKLLDYPQVVTTPHVASNTIESRQEMEKEAIENLINELRKD